MRLVGSYVRPVSSNNVRTITANFVDYVSGDPNGTHIKLNKPLCSGQFHANGLFCYICNKIRNKIPHILLRK